MKTSESHPLVINSVTTTGDGMIGLTICPGKKQVHSMTGPWDRDLDADLDQIAAFGATVLVTLMEEDELSRVGVPVERLAGEVSGRGMEWHHLSIVDVSVPNDSWEQLWSLSGPRLRAKLRAGEKIVVHCRGGLGRAGTVAGRLLVELGADPCAAIEEIRAARPGAIETREQEDHVRSATFVSPGPGTADRIVGSLIAGAIGDALGAPVEFMSLDRIRHQFGPNGLRRYAPCYGRLGAITDDTQMLMFTAEGLIRGFLHREPPDVDALANSVWHSYRRWLRTQHGPMPDETPSDGWLLQLRDLWSQRAPGNTCLGSLRSGKMGTVTAPIGFSKGCGGIMRVAPAGLVGGLLDSPGDVFRLGAATAAITHGHPSGYDSAGFLAGMLDGILKGKGRMESLAEADRILSGFRQPENAGEVHRAVQGVRVALDAHDPTPERLETLGEGWVGEEALAISLYAALSFAEVEETLLFAVNHSGDTDSTGAIAGNILGAEKGAEAIPPQLWRPLEHLYPLLHLAGDLTTLVLGGPDALRESAGDRYPPDGGDREPS